MNPKGNVTNKKEKRISGGIFPRKKAGKEVHAAPKISCWTREALVAQIDENVNQILRENLYELHLNQQQLLQLQQQKKNLRRQLKRGGTGDPEAKEQLIVFIQEELLSQCHITEETITKTFLFSEEGRKEVGYQFDILLYLARKKYGVKAFEHLIEDHGLLTVDGGTIITREQIQKLYQKTGQTLTFIQQLELLSQKVYAYYKGLGAIDEIRDMAIDGVSGGVSGAKGNYRNVWIFYKGRSIYLEFLDLENERETERICRNLCRYHQPGELSKNRGYLIHEMADHSRVVVARPDFAENWLFFVRKLDHIQVRKLPQLVTGTGSELVTECLRWLVKGCQTMGITGMQGCGKTTLLMSLVEEIPPEYTIRVLELAFELHLRESYPKRNIVTFRETASIDGFEGLEVQKKTDGAVSIIGEVAGAKVAAWMIESGQSGSIFTMFTHHAKTAEGLIYSLRNSLLKEGNFSSEEIAQSQVTQVVRFDVHLHMNRSGQRYVERISEILPAPGFPEGFQVRHLVEYRDGAYVQRAHISDTTRQNIEKWLTQEEKEAFAVADI